MSSYFKHQHLYINYLKYIFSFSCFLPLAQMLNFWSHHCFLLTIKLLNLGVKMIFRQYIYPEYFCRITGRRLLIIKAHWIRFKRRVRYCLVTSSVFKARFFIKTNSYDQKLRFHWWISQVSNWKSEFPKWNRLASFRRWE